MSTQKLYFPAEWEPSRAILMAWPHKDTDWNYMLDDVQQCFVEISKAIVKHSSMIVVAPDLSEPTDKLTRALGKDVEKIKFVQLPTNDTWARDFGPISLIDKSEPFGHPTYLDFKFNGWGLKFASDKDNLVTSRLFENEILKGDYVNRLGFVLEGGSIETDGNGTLLTTSRCLLSPNRNGEMTRAEIEKYLKETLNIKHILWLEHGYLAGDDTDSHTDTLARLAPDNTIVYVGCDNPDDEHYTELKMMEDELKEMRTADGKPYNLVALPLPDPIYDEEGERLPATYANYLVVNNAVLMPVYGQKAKDLLASQIIKIAFPEHQIITIDCNALIRQHGSLHCMTMQIPS